MKLSKQAKELKDRLAIKRARRIQPLIFGSMIENGKTRLEAAYMIRVLESCGFIPKGRAITRRKESNQMDQKDLDLNFETTDDGEVASVIHPVCAHCKQIFEVGQRVVQVIVGDVAFAASFCPEEHLEADEYLIVNKATCREYHISCYSMSNRVID